MINAQVIINAPINLEFAGKTNYDTIFYPGAKLKLYQQCITTIDTIITFGTATFTEAHIKNIGECVYMYALKDTMVKKIEIRTKGKAGFIALKKYFQEITKSNYIEAYIDSNSVSTAICNFNSKLSQLILFSDKKNKHSTLLIELADIDSY